MKGLRMTEYIEGFRDEEIGTVKRICDEKGTWRPLNLDRRVQG